MIYMHGSKYIEGSGFKEFYHKGDSKTVTLVCLKLDTLMGLDFINKLGHNPHVKINPLSNNIFGHLDKFIRPSSSYFGPFGP